MGRENRRKICELRIEKKNAKAIRGQREKNENINLKKKWRKRKGDFGKNRTRQIDRQIDELKIIGVQWKRKEKVKKIKDKKD